MKKYTVKDEDGKVVEVTEYEKGEAPVAAQPSPADQNGQKPEKTHDEVFSEEQVAEIKRIVTEAVAAALKPAEQPTPAPEAPVEDPAKPKEEEHTGDSLKKDSKTNPGAIPQKQVKDAIVSDEDIAKKENEINSAWENRWK